MTQPLLKKKIDTNQERFNAEAEKIRRKTGCITAQAVINAARNPKSPIHDLFEWDDKIASEKYRLSEALFYIRGWKFVFARDNEVVNEALSDRFVNQRAVHDDGGEVRRVLPDDGKTGEYITREEILARAEKRASFIIVKKRELRAWCASIPDIEELSELRNLILQALQSH